MDFDPVDSAYDEVEGFETKEDLNSSQITRFSLKDDEIEPERAEPVDENNRPLVTRGVHDYFSGVDGLGSPSMELDDDATRELLMALSSPSGPARILPAEEPETPTKSKKRHYFSESDVQDTLFSWTEPSSAKEATLDDTEKTISLKELLSAVLPRVDTCVRQHLLELHNRFKLGRVTLEELVLAIRKKVTHDILVEVTAELQETPKTTRDYESFYLEGEQDRSSSHSVAGDDSDSFDAGSQGADPLSNAHSTMTSATASSDTSVQPGAGRSKSKKRTWSHLEHLIFLKGLQIFGRGKWKHIAAAIPGRSVNQVTSHGKKFLLRQKKNFKDKHMRSIHDLVLDSPEMRELEKALENGDISSPGFDLKAVGIVQRIRSNFRVIPQNRAVSQQFNAHSLDFASHQTSERGGAFDVHSLLQYYDDQAAVLSDPLVRDRELRLRKLEHTSQLLKQTVATLRVQICGGYVDPRGS